jgi:hypothetical protein
VDGEHHRAAPGPADALLAAALCLLLDDFETSRRRRGAFGRRSLQAKAVARRGVPSRRLKEERVVQADGLGHADLDGTSPSA